MKKLLFLFCFFVATSAFAQTPTATATATDSPTATPTATASATATATGTPVPTPTPYSVITRQDTQGQQKPLELQQVDADRVTVANDGPAAKVSGPQDIATGSAPQFISIYVGFVNSLSGTLDVGCLPSTFVEPAPLNCIEMASGEYLKITNNTGSQYVVEDTSLITDARNQKRPDKDGILALLSDIPASNVIGETHFAGPDPVHFASIYGNIASVEYVHAGQYLITFAVPLSDINYGVTIGIGHGDSSVSWVSDTDLSESGTDYVQIETKSFNPGILGVALPSFALADPDQVTVVITKNP